MWIYTFTELLKYGHIVHIFIWIVNFFLVFFTSCLVSPPPSLHPFYTNNPQPQAFFHETMDPILTYYVSIHVSLFVYTETSM